MMLTNVLDGVPQRLKDSSTCRGSELGCGRLFVCLIRLYRCWGLSKMTVYMRPTIPRVGDRGIAGGPVITSDDKFGDPPVTLRDRPAGGVCFPGQQHPEASVVCEVSAEVGVRPARYTRFAFAGPFPGPRRAPPAAASAVKPGQQPVAGDISTHTAHHGRCWGVRRGGLWGVGRLTRALRGDGDRTTPGAVSRARRWRALIGHTAYNGDERNW
jgi:hypothetical protein